jgi:hypothetical protein
LHARQALIRRSEVDRPLGLERHLDQRRLFLARITIAAAAIAMVARKIVMLR